MINLFKNIYNRLIGRYLQHPEAVIIACYYNSQNNPYRKKAFDIWYESIKHLNHRIIECTTNGSKPQLPNSEFIKVIDTPSTLWHKESLLNLIIADLPMEFKYVFWLDTDIIFKNKQWLTQGVKELKSKNLIQPFEYCAHLEKDELEYSDVVPISFNTEYILDRINRGMTVSNIKTWRSYCANNASGKSKNCHYDVHGHVGFAWGARREILDRVPLYDRALIGGADHIIAHAGSGHINHSCIAKSFTENIDEVNRWSEKFYKEVRNEIGFVEGDLLHIWHGDINKREYYQRIKEFTPITKTITKKDENGLYEIEDDTYVKDYFERREVQTDDLKPIKKSKQILNVDQLKEKKRKELKEQHPNQDDSFIDSLMIGYLTDSTLIGGLLGGNPLGAMIGDILNEPSSSESTGFKDGFGDGEFSGGGSGGSWPESNSDMGSTFS